MDFPLMSIKKKHISNILLDVSFHFPKLFTQHDLPCSLPALWSAFPLAFSPRRQCSHSSVQRSPATPHTAVNIFPAESTCVELGVQESEASLKFPIGFYVQQCSNCNSTLRELVLLKENCSVVDVQTCTREELKHRFSSLKYRKKSMGSLPREIAASELQGVKYCI